MRTLSPTAARMWNPLGWKATAIASSPIGHLQQISNFLSAQFQIQMQLFEQVTISYFRKQMSIPVISSKWKGQMTYSLIVDSTSVPSSAMFNFSSWLLRSTKQSTSSVELSTQLVILVASMTISFTFTLSLEQRRYCCSLQTSVSPAASNAQI